MGKNVGGFTKLVVPVVSDSSLNCRTVVNWLFVHRFGARTVFAGARHWISSLARQHRSLYFGLLMTPYSLAPWRSDWLWSIPLIVVTIVFHAYTLGLLSRGLLLLLRSGPKKRLLHAVSVFVVGGSSLCAICLHCLEAWMWAIAYCLLGALADYKGAMLYSISAMTTVGGSNLSLEPRWQLMGSLEALDGWLLFGLTAAFLFAVIQKVWSLEHS
jgi:hypothetical protein